MSDLLRKLLFLPDAASTIADRIDWLHFFVIITTMLVSTAVGLTTLAFFVRYRRRSETQITPLITPTLIIEILFVGVPLVFFLAWFAIGFRDYVYIASPPKDAMDVYVTGKQWMWKFTYPEGPGSVSVLRVPAGRPVRLLLTSRDVIHSFFIPDFRVKMDVLPGRYTQLWFEAKQPGRYQILCTEYCGLNHSTMLGEVVALAPAEFDDWMSEQRRTLPERQDSQPVAMEPVDPDSSLSAQGERIAASQGCLKCHSLDGSAHIGPTWLNLFQREEALVDGRQVKVDESYLTRSMMDPHAEVVRGFDPVMPSFQGRLSAPEVAALVEFIKTLSSERNERRPQ